MRYLHTLILPALASLCLVFFVAFAARAGEMETVKLELVKESVKAPDISYIDEFGDEQKVDPDGHPLTLLHFWATWCVPCVDELPQLDDAQKIFGKKLQIVPVSMDGRNVIKVQRFYRSHKIVNLKVAVDETNKASTKAGLKGLPGTLFIDAQGNVVARADGPLDWQQEDVANFIKGRLK